MTTRASCGVWKISPFKSSSRSFPLKDSTYPFSQGEPGSIKSVLTPTRSSLRHAKPLSDVFHTSAASLWTQKFPCAASRKIEVSIA